MCCCAVLLCVVDNNEKFVTVELPEPVKTGQEFTLRSGLQHTSSLCVHLICDVCCMTLVSVATPTDNILEGIYYGKTNTPTHHPDWHVCVSLSPSCRLRTSW